MSVILCPRRSPLGLRGLKSEQIFRTGQAQRRSPLGLRGLKCGLIAEQRVARKSQPSWAAWIEIDEQSDKGTIENRRSPLGLRGLK